MTNFDPKEYWEKRLADMWNLTGVGYRALGGGFNRWSYAVAKRIFTREVRKLHQPMAARALDIGPGTGFFTQILMNEGYRVSGIDISATAVAGLRKKFPGLTFTEGRARDVTGSYELITAIAVLFHIVDDNEYKATIQKIYESLSDDGYFLFTENFPPETISHQHIVMHSNAWLVETLENAGFEIMSRQSFGLLMCEPVKRGRSLRWTLLSRALRRAPQLGWIIGALLYPFELIAVRLPVRSSTEIVVCRKRRIVE